MLMRPGRLADRFPTVNVMEGSREAGTSRDDGNRHPVAVAVMAVVLVISIVALATAAALALNHVMDAALAFTLGQSV
jgi:hypothetical protein